MAPRSFLPSALWRRLFDGRLPADDRALADQLDRVGHVDLADEAAFFGATRGEAALRVTVFGEYNVGKSTLVNALLGRQLLAARLRPTTGVPVEIRDGAERVRIAYRDSREALSSLAEADRASSLDGDARARDDIDRILIELPSPLLANGLVLVDTPGVLDAAAQTERARREVSAADVVLLVLRADHLLSHTERDYAVRWLTGELAKPVVPVVNFMGRVPPAEQADLRALLGDLTRHLIPALPARWYEVDALPALRHRLGVAGAPAPTDGTAALLADLTALGQQGARIKASSRAGWEASWRRRAKAANADLLSRLEREATVLARARAEEVRNLRRRIDALDASVADGKSAVLARVAEFKCRGRKPVIAALPGDAALVTEEGRAKGAAAVAERLVAAQAEIDVAADAALGRLAAGSGINLEPLSVRELAALDVPAAATLDAAGETTALAWAAGALGLTLWYGLAWKIAIPVALVGWIVGRGAATVSRQISEFRDGLAANADRSLDRMAGLMTGGIEARARELRAALGRRLRAAEAPLPVGEELRIRRHLAKVLGDNRP